MQKAIASKTKHAKIDIASLSLTIAGLWYILIYVYGYLNGVSYPPFLEIEASVAILTRHRALAIWLLNIPRTINMVAAVYGFESIYDFTYNITQNYDLGFKGYIFFGLVITTFFAINIFVAIKYPSRRLKNKISTAAVFFLVAISFMAIEKWTPLKTNLIGAPWLNYTNQYRNFTTEAPRFYSTEPPIQLRNLKGQNVYFFLLESHTQLIDDKLSDELFDNIKFPIERKKLDARFGSTFRGEMRELCGLIAYPDISSSIFPSTSTCLPSQLNATYRTVALHGGAKGMYKRNFVYPLMGFQEYYSLTDFSSVSACGGGWKNHPCDINILDFYERNIKDERKTFMYFLTINTHNPYTPTTYAKGPCPNSLRDNESMCNHFMNIAGLLNTINQFAMRNPGIYILAGDHPPPLLREYYSKDKIDRIIFESK